MSQVKVTVNLSDEAVEALKAIANKRGISITEAFHLAIGQSKYLEDATRDGKKILVEEHDGKMKQVTFP